MLSVSWPERRVHVENRDPLYRKLPLDAALALLLAAVIAPFVLLSFFNHPQNDDYVIASQSLAWGHLQTFVFWYKAWTPRYFAIAGSVLSPLVFKSIVGYKLMAALTICLTLLSVYLFARQLTRGALNRRAAMLVALAVAAVYLFKLPAAPQSLYWFNASLCYQYGGILLLMTAALAMHARRVESRRRSALLSVGAAVLLIAAAGTNELSLIFELEILGLVAVMELWRRRAVSKQTFLLLAAWVAAAVAVFLSPGMWVRHHQFPHNAWLSLRATIESTASHLGTWLFATPLLPVFALVFAFARPEGDRILPFRLHPGLAFAGSLAILLSLFFIPLYGAESAEERVVASIYFIFLILFFLNCCLGLDHLRDRSDQAASASPTRPRSPSWLSSFLTLVAVVLMCVLPASTLRTAYADVLSGRAYRFDRQMWARYRSIQSCKTGVCEVTPLKDWPSTIKFFEDAHDPKKDDAFFTNYKRAFAGYYGKTAIVLKP
jgi:Family of unknown function (DUF6056)